MTDIAVLVIAADHGMMRQTIEAISHAKAAGVPNANIERAILNNSALTKVRSKMGSTTGSPLW